MSIGFASPTWIYKAQAIVAGSLGLFGLVLGPLFLFGLMSNARGNPAPDAGFALTIISIPLLLVCALAMTNIRARRQHLLRLHREGIEIIIVGASSLDRFPLIPGLIRVAWLILSTQGFRQRVVRIPWDNFGDAWASGPPSAGRLTIVALHLPEFSGDAPIAGEVVLRQHEFAKPLEEIAAVLLSAAKDPKGWGELTSWDAAR